MAGGFDFVATAFLAVDEGGDEGDFAAFFFDGVDCGESGFAAGDHIVDDDNGMAGFEVAFDQLGLAVRLWGFAN